MHPGNRTHRQRGSQAGFTFAELALGLLVLVTISAVMISHLTVSLRATVDDRDRLYAFGKAQAILAEVQGLVDDGHGSTDSLDALDDGVVSKDTLTIMRDENGDLVLPDHPVSGNYRRAGEWVWSRRITVQPFSGVDNRNVRYVTVRVFQRSGDTFVREVADVSAVVNATGVAFPTTQVFDLYLLAIENIPGWWVFMDSIRPFVESTITDLETRNPGLEVRTHWITKASFGRDQAYRPYINESRDSLQGIPGVYHYPGRMPAGSASTYYYVPANIMARMSRDGVESGGFDDDLNPFPYALADFYNHASRYPDEVRLWNQRVKAVRDREDEIAAARAAGSAPPAPLADMSKEPTLRLLLEDLNTNPAKYRNALVINLHGELLPVPALRNYSDAARAPDVLPEVRVVTHPERLRTPRDPAGGGTESAAFRVYAYNTHTRNYRAASRPEVLSYPIAVEVMGVDLTDSASGRPSLLPEVRLQYLQGGVPLAGDSTYSTNFAPAKVVGDPSLRAGEMYYAAEFRADGEEAFTRILLFNTPCVAPPVANRGLAEDDRSQPYGMAYVPSPCGSGANFSRHLGSTGTGPKNTARWRFEVPATAFSAPLFVDPDGTRSTRADDVTLEVRTRIWTGADASTSGTMWPLARRNAPANLSRTYTWWADSPDDVPMTERSQFLGDPRHMPYLDLQTGAGDFADGYNWYFDSLQNGNNATSDFPGLDEDRLENGWRGYTTFDAPRMLEVLRKGLVTSGCVYTTLTGFSYYYLGIGGEIGYDSANGYPNSIPVDQTPYGSPGSAGFVNTITDTRRFVRSNASGSGYWWCKPWLGEICPDVAYARWLTEGNLPAGSGSGAYRQAPVDTVYGGSDAKAYGTRMPRTLHRLKEEGCTSFFNTGSAGQTFHHQYSSGVGDLTLVGQQIADNYHFNMPNQAPISRPFGLQTSSSGTVGTEWDFAPYANERFATNLLQLYYTHPSRNAGSGLVQVTDPGNSSAAYVVVNGIDKTVDSGSNFIAKFSVLSLVHSFFEAGGSLVRHRIEQPPRVEITQPTDVTDLVNPTAVDIVVDVSWRRWDGLDYTEAGSAIENESELEYAVMYSRDGGATWQHIRDDSAASPGERPQDLSYLYSDTGVGAETFNWPLPFDRFPQGSYYLRVDCFRRGAPIHYSYHKTKLFVQR